MRHIAALVGAALFLVACQGPFGGARQALPAETGVGTRATFVVASLAGLIGLGADGKPLGRIVELPAGAAPSAPILHPSGDAIAFALSLATPSGFGSDIYLVNLDGSGLRALVEHDQPNVFLATPAFDPTGNLLYFHRRAPILSTGQFAGGQYVGNEDTIHRLDLRTGERRRILEGAAEPTLSPDGRTLLYVRFERGERLDLGIAGADGAGPRPFLKTGDTFSYLQTPRFSPSGREVIFSSTGRVRSDDRSLPPLRVASRGGKLAHLGLPSYLYVATVDGSSLRSVGATGADDVFPAWSPNGAHVAYVTTGAFFVVGVADGAVKVRTEGFVAFFGDVLWLR